MKIYLLDTNIISELTKPFPDPNVFSKIRRNISDSSISSLTLMEAVKGYKERPDGKRKDELFSYAVDFLQQYFDVLPFGVHEAWVFTDLESKLRAKGRPAPVIDMMIAATAIANNLVLVTRNLKDFQPMAEVSSLMLENWFEL